MTVGNFLQLWHDRNRCASSLGESSVPPAHGKLVHTHTTINFDGREVATGVAFFQVELGAKQLELLHELLPGPRRIGLLVNANNKDTEAVTRDLIAAGSAIGVQIEVVQLRRRMSAFGGKADMAISGRHVCV